MIKDSTNVYIKPSEAVEQRIDFVHNHPNLDILKDLKSHTPYEVERLGGEIRDEPLIEKIASGSTPRGINYLDEGIYFLGAGNILENKLDLEEVSLIDSEVHENRLESSQLSQGDVLITMAGTIGRCCVYTREDAANINQAIAKVEVNENILHPKYLSLYLNSEFGQKGFWKYRHDVSQPNINTEEIQKIKIVVPPLDKQRKIVERAEKELEIKREFEEEEERIREDAPNRFLDELNIEVDSKPSMFFETQREDTGFYTSYPSEIEELRLDYFAHHPKMRLLQEAKEKINFVKLESICEDSIRRGTRPEYSEEGDIMVIKTADLKSSHINYEDTRRVSKEFFEENEEAQVRRGDVLVCSTGLGSVGKVDVYDKDHKAVVDGHISILRTDKNYNPYFLAFFLRSYLGKLQFEKWFSGASGQIEIQPEDLSRFLVPSPEEYDLAKQNRISQDIQEEYEKALELREKAEKKLSDLKNQFQKEIEQ